MKIGVKLALAQSLLLLALGLAFAMAVSMQLGERLRARAATRYRVVEDAPALDAYNQALKGNADQYARMFESGADWPIHPGQPAHHAAGSGARGHLAGQHRAEPARVDEVTVFTVTGAWPRCLPAPASNCCG
ncbi:MAG: hypothetical protein U1E47_02990 [Rivihabitans pingtungensis]